MNEQTPDEIRARYADKLGREFGEYFFHLDQSVIGLVAIWDTYRFFFGTNEERVELLNQASGYVARTFQDSLHERVILGICQVSDPSTSRGRKNVTVRGLPDFISGEVHRNEIQTMLEHIEESTSFARELRNKLIAHSDLAAVNGSYSVDFSSRERIVVAIRSIIAPLRYLHKQYFDVHKLYHPIISLPGASGFLRCVYLGVAKQEEELRMMRSGNVEALPSRSLPDWLYAERPNEFDQ